MDWKKLLAYITGSVDQELLLRKEYLVTENRILRNQINGRVRLTDGERKTLADLAKKLGKKALEEVANIVKPDTLLRWYRRLIANKFDGSKNRRYPGRPRVDAEIEELLVRFARENRTWGYDRIAGALRNLGHKVSDQSVGNILRRHDIPRRRCEVRPQLGKSLSDRTRRFWPRRTFSPRRCGPDLGLSRTTFCFSCTWLPAACTSPASRRIRTSNG